MKPRILLASFLSFFLLLFNYTKAAETEPNNTPATANVLPLNGSNSGSISTGTDVDWYKVTTTGDGALTLTLTISNGQYGYFQLYDTLGVIQLQSNYTSSTYSYTVDGLAKGTYYVEILPYDNNNTPNYTISNTLAVPTQANDHEPDSTPAQANTIALNGSTTGHINYYYNNHKDSVDWYKFTTNADGAINLQLDIANGNYVYFQLYDGDGVTQLHSDYTSSSYNYTVDGLAQGTYYVKIIPYTSGYFAPYTLTNTLIPAAYTNDAVTDSTPAQAITFGLNDSITGHINYYYNNHKDSVDWYKFTTNADGAINLQLDIANGNYVYFQLYDGDGVTQLHSDYTSSSYNYTVDGLAQGTYYVKIIPYTSGYFAPYKLHNKLITTGQANDKEPNSTPATAATLPLNGSTTGHINYYYNHYKDSSDWYKLTTDSNGAVNLQLDVANGNYVYFQLYAADGSTLLHGDYTASSFNYTVDGLGKGVYYVKITPYNDGYFAPYTLKDTLYTYNPADTVPNDHFTQAVTIPVNRTVTGDVGFYFYPIRDTADYWKINYTGTGNMTLTLGLQPTVTGGIHYTYFQVYQDTTAAPIFSDYTAGSTYEKDFTGLTQGYYYVKVFEYYGGDFNPYSLTLSFTQVNIAAAAVKSTRPSLDSCGGNSITYSLSKSHSPYGVELYHNGVKYDSVNVASDTARFNNLPDGNYYATVYGDGATDAAFGTSSVTTFLPPTPKGLTTSNILVHTAQLNWTPYSCVKSYSVQYRPSSSTTWTTLSDANDAIGKYTLTGLTMYTNYTWRVASVDTAQGVAIIGNYSDTMLFKTLSDTAIITVTKVTTGTTCNSSSIKYTSTHSVAPYTVQLYRNGAVYGSPASSTDTTLFTGLPAGIYYATSSGTGSGGSFGTSAMDTILPPAPMGLTTTSIKTTSATFNWTPLSCEHNYVIEYHKAGASTWTMINSLGNTTGTYTLNGLSVYTSYVWRIASSDSAEGKQLLSPYSDSVTFITLSNPAHITLFRSVQTNACYSDTLKYVASNSIAPYTVQLYRDSLAYGSPVSVTDTAVFTGLPSGVYYASALGTGSGDTTGRSATTTLAPPFPTNLSTDSVHAMSAMLNWTPLTCVSYFTIQYKLSTSGTWTNTITVPADSSSYYLAGLTPATTYNWRIASVDTTNGLFIVSSYSSTATFTTMSVLPVTLLKFNATPVNNTVQISWQTANETNSKSFTVLRSADGVTFTSVGLVSAFGNTNIQHQYSFIDNSPLSGTSYYRLRQVDNDGSFTDSKTVSVTLSGASLFTLYPNPAVNTVHINFLSTSAAMLVVYDMNGKALIQKAINAGSGSQTINVGALAAGTYTVVIRQDKQQQSIKFVKR